MVKLYDSEIKVMNLLWEKGSMKAADIAKEMERRIGWNKNTTYTVIKKCVSKGAIERREPGFVCVPVVEKIDIQRSQTKEFLQKVFDGSSLNFLSSVTAPTADLIPFTIPMMRSRPQLNA